MLLYHKDREVSSVFHYFVERSFRFLQGTFSCVIIQTMETIKKNKEYIVTIEAYNSESSGVARIDGRAVFIPNALKGEVWHIKVLKVTAAAVYGKGLELLKPSPERREPQFPNFSRCGGCSTWQLSLIHI